VCGFLLCVCFLCVFLRLSSLFVHFFGLDSINQSINSKGNEEGVVILVPRGCDGGLSRLWSELFVE
jgi:hypothetical protein